MPPITEAIMVIVVEERRVGEALEEGLEEEVEMGPPREVTARGGWLELWAEGWCLKERERELTCHRICAGPDSGEHKAATRAIAIINLIGGEDLVLIAGKTFVALARGNSVPDPPQHIVPRSTAQAAQILAEMGGVEIVLGTSVVAV